MDGRVVTLRRSCSDGLGARFPIESARINPHHLGRVELLRARVLRYRRQLIVRREGVLGFGRSCHRRLLLLLLLLRGHGLAGRRRGFSR